MTITKLNEDDGAKIWEMTYVTGSGAETVAFTSDGGFVVGGYVNSNTSADSMNFKSGGQCEDGQPFLGKISATDAAGTTAPTAFAWTYTQTDTVYAGSAKALRVDSSDNVFAIACTKSCVIKLNGSGTEVWKTGQIDSAIQSNDLEIATDGVVLVGHRYSTSSTGCDNSSCSVIKGAMMKLDTAGTKVWGYEYGNYAGGKNQFVGLTAGLDVLVYNECWGVAPRYDSAGTT